MVRTGKLEEGESCERGRRQGDQETNWGIGGGWPEGDEGDN